MSEILPNGWAREILEEVADIRDFEREPINSSEREARINGKSKSELYPYYGATGQVGFIDSYRSEGQRVLLGEDAAPFLDPAKDKAYLANGRFWVNNHAHVLTGAVNLIDNKFLCHQLNTVDYHPFVTGSTRLKLTSSAMKQIPIVVAPAAEQTRIVTKLEELLSDLDAGVAELKAAQKKLAQYRQSLLKAAVEGALTAEWREQQKTVRAEPVEAPPQSSPSTSSGRTATGETGAQLLERILTERRARWEARQLARFKEQGKTPPKDWQKKYPEPVQPDTTDLPELPEGWVWVALDSLICDGPQNGLYLPASRYGSGTPILRIDDYQIGWYRELALLNLVDSDAEMCKTYALAENDLVINRVNSMTHLGKSLLVTESLSGALFESNMMRLNLATEVSSEFVTYYLGSDVGRTRLIHDAKWAVNQASINQQDVRRTPLPLPPIDEQRAIARTLHEQLGAVIDQGEEIEKSLKQSAAQRQNILHAAFTGQLVPQDPNDEPASVLLERIRAERAAQATTKKPRGRKAKEPA